MKLAKKPGKEEKTAVKQLRKYLKTDEEMVSLMLTYMGCISMLMDFLTEQYGTPEKIQAIDQRTKYAISLSIMHYKMLGSMIRGEVKPEEMGMRWMSIQDDAWSHPKEINDRMVMVVKQLYTELKEAGKL